MFRTQNSRPLRIFILPLGLNFLRRLMNISSTTNMNASHQHGNEREGFIDVGAERCTGS